VWVKGYRPPSLDVKVRRDVEELVIALAERYGLERWWARNVALLYGVVALSEFLDKNPVDRIPELFEELKRLAEKRVGRPRNKHLTVSG